MKNVAGALALAVVALLASAAIAVHAARRRVVVSLPALEPPPRAPLPRPPRPPGPMRRVVVTPAGRRQYLALLHRHLDAQRDDFDEWWLLANAPDPEDAAYCERLAARVPWARLLRGGSWSNPRDGSRNVSRLLNHFCRDPSAAFMKIDDDVVYLAPGFVRTLFDFRFKNPHYFLVYGNTINMPLLTWLHAKLGNFEPPRRVAYDPFCEGAWKDGRVAEALHRAFLRDPLDPKWVAFERWIGTDHERMSINAVVWFGADLGGATIGPDDEQWMAVDRPRELGTHNAVCGAAVCAHFSFYTQRAHLDATDLLERYGALAPRRARA